MNAPARTVRRRTSRPHRGRPIVLIIPPHCDYITLRQLGRRKAYDIDLASVYDLAAKKEAAHLKAEKTAKRKGRAA